MMMDFFNFTIFELLKINEKIYNTEDTEEYTE